MPSGLWDRPPDAPKPEPRFSFEYDFQKYELSSLGRLFGLPQWEASDRCVQWIRKISPDVTSMYDFVGRRKRGRSNSYSEGTHDNFHSYGTYVAWHALALTAGTLFLERPFALVESYVDSWEDLISKYRVTRADGSWISDGTEPPPSFALDDLLDGASVDRRPTDDYAALLRLTGIELGKPLSASVLVSGCWRSPDGVGVDISSALVPREHAKCAAIALGTAPEHHMHLPILRAFGDEDEEFGSSENDPCTPFISRRQAYAKLDNLDPYGSQAAIARDRLTMAVNNNLSLSSKDPWSAIWHRPRNRMAYIAQAWGVHVDEEDGDRSEQGTSVVCDVKFLRGALRKYRCDLLVLINLSLFISARDAGYEEESIDRLLRSWVTLVINEAGIVTRVEPSASDLETIRKLDDRAIHTFNDRFNALLREHKKTIVE